MDRFARYFIFLGGGALIVCVLAIMLVLLWQVLPLMRSPSAFVSGDFAALPENSADNEVLGLQMDEYQQNAIVVSAQGLRIASLDEKADKVQALPPLPGLNGAKILRVADADNGYCVAALSDGRMLPFRARFASRFEGQKRVTASDVTAGAPIEGLGAKPVEVFTYAQNDDGPFFAVKTGPHEAQVIVTDDGKVSGKYAAKLPEGSGEITALALDSRRDYLCVGTADGKIHRFGLDKIETPRWDGSVDASAGTSPVSCLAFLPGGKTLASGLADGNVST